MNRLFKYLILILCLLIVLIPRFDRQDLGPVSKFTGKGTLIYDNGTYHLGELPIDAHQYVLMTAYFRGEDVISDIGAPFSYRPLTPYLASLLPLNPLTAINIINTLFLIFSLILLFKILEKLGYKDKCIMVGCLLFIFSFPAFYYSVIGYIDPVAIFFLTIGLFLLLHEKWLLLCAVFFIGPFGKEIIVILLPVILIYMYYTKKPKKNYIYILLYFLLFISAYYWSRTVIPLEKDYFWSPAVHTIFENILRPRAYISFTLTFGLVGVLAFMGIYINYKKKSVEQRNSKKFLMTGVAAAIALFAYSIFAAYSDGRFVWPMYPFAIPLALDYLVYRKERKIAAT